MDKNIDKKYLEFKNEKIKYLYLNPDTMSSKLFIEELLDMNFVEKGKMYAFLIKIRRTDGSFKMSGKHEIWYSDVLSKNIIDLYKKILSKINDFIVDYKDEDIDLIQVMLMEINPLPELKLKNINKLKLNKELVKVGETKKQFNENYIPFSMNLNYYGEKLDYNINEESHIDYINLNGKNIFENIVFDYDNPEIKGGSKTILNKIKDKSKINIFLYSRKFNTRYTEFNNEIIRNHLLIVNDNDINQRLIEVFVINDKNNRFGNPKLVSYDRPLNEDKSEFIRNINDFSLHIYNDKVIKYENKIILPIIKYKDLSLDKHVRNSNIGVFDIETYYDIKKDKSFTYALGFKIFKGETKLFYKKIDQSSNDLIIECLNSMLTHAYDKYTFYVHNLHGYDSIFILSALLDYNSKNDNFYKIKTIFRDNRVIKLEVSIKTGSKNSSRKITFVDSYLMLPASLDKISKDFECFYSKGKFPYEFVNESKLYYIGDTPEKIYFKEISDNEYNSIVKIN
jgi:hypothetical protein